MIDIKNSIKKILVTGGGGFIGGCLIRRLLNESSAQIYNLDKMGYASNISGIQKTLNTLGQIKKSRHNLLKVDLINYELTLDAVKYANPDLVIHLAAESHVDRSIDDPEIFLRSNIYGTFNLLQSVRIYWESLSEDRQKNFRILHISTDEVYGSLGKENKFSETTQYNPRSPYSASKASSDHLVNAWHHTYGLPIIVTNCSNNFGPWQFPEKLIPNVILKALNNEKIPLYGDGSNIRDWLYVEDHVEALLMTLIKAKPGSNYCIGGFGERTNKEVVYLICDILDKIIPSKNLHSSLVNFVKDRPGHDKRYAIDSALIRQEIGWQPRYNFEEALEKTVKWYVKNKVWCESVLKEANYSGGRIGLNSNL
tara:strand:+ start:50 stop:1150 length:1101 start_codon:yes stop_codon:yes gene_type:complete